MGLFLPKVYSWKDEGKLTFNQLPLWYKSAKSYQEHMLPLVLYEFRSQLFASRQEPSRTFHEVVVESVTPSCNVGNFYTITFEHFDCESVQDRDIFEVATKNKIGFTFASAQCSGKQISLEISSMDCPWIKPQVTVKIRQLTSSLTSLRQYEAVCSFSDEVNVAKYILGIPLQALQSSNKDLAIPRARTIRKKKQRDIITYLQSNQKHLNHSQREAVKYVSN